jgi:adenine-specific DNA glycosylase
MWQFITLPADEPAEPEAMRKLLPVQTGPARRLGVVTHGLTHRRYHFDVFACESTGNDEPMGAGPRAWTTLDGLSKYPLPRPHVKVAELLRAVPS